MGWSLQAKSEPVMMTSSSESTAAVVYDVIVVGAGPAGLRAAVRAGQSGASVALIDSGEAPGGQFWRRPSDLDLARKTDHLHHALSEYRQLVDQLARACMRGSTLYLPRHDVWTMSKVGQRFVAYTVGRSATQGGSRSVAGCSVVLATGAYDRQVPFPGWTLPGVMTAGGVQSLLKGDDVRAGRRVIVAGTGPFLLPVAAGLATAGAEVLGVHEAGSPSAWLRHVVALARNIPKLGEGVGYVATLARHRVPIRTGSILIRVDGRDGVETATVARSNGEGGTVAGTERQVACDTVAMGWGFTPQVELALALGCAIQTDLDGSVIGVVDENQRSSVDGVYLAGETCGVGGAALASVEGAIAGAAAVGSSTRELFRRRKALRSFATAMHSAHPVPPGWMARLESDTVICRCEEVTIDQLRQTVDAYGALDARDAKLLARSGMGWCQGRVCGYATACLMADLGGNAYDPSVVARRPIAAPLTLRELGETK